MTLNPHFLGVAWCQKLWSRCSSGLMSFLSGHHVHLKSELETFVEALARAAGDFPVQGTSL